MDQGGILTLKSHCLSNIFKAVTAINMESWDDPVQNKNLEKFHYPILDVSKDVCEEDVKVTPT